MPPGSWGQFLSPHTVPSKPSLRKPALSPPSFPPPVCHAEALPGRPGDAITFGTFTHGLCTDRASCQRPQGMEQDTHSPTFQNGAQALGSPPPVRGDGQCLP